MSWKLSPLVIEMGLFFLTVACVNPSDQAAVSGGRSPAPDEAPRTKSITIGVASGVRAMAAMGVETTTTGGWRSVNEVHSNALTTSDTAVRRPVPRLAERVPSLEDGSLSLLADGRMRVVYRIRPGITWQDGAPFSAHDLVFSYRLNSDRGLPNVQSEANSRMQSVDAPDPLTFIVNFNGPYSMGGALGLRLFWPYPQHLLGPAYEAYLATGNADEVMNLAYWTSDYVHLGPFRLTSFDPAEGMAFRAYEAYFLGRPKIDVVRVRLFGDENALFSNLLAGTVDLFMESTITPELGFQLKSRWESSDQGTVYITQGFTRFLTPQWRPSVLTEPANLDARVRTALYRALDREALSEGLQAGHRELALWSLLPPGDRYYEATRDGFRPHSFDPDRARAGLAEAGWTPGPDGVLRHQSDGRRFRNTISEAGDATREVAAYADSWRRIGIEVDEVRVPPAQVRDREYRAQYASWEVSGGSGDSIFSRLEGPAASAQNRWVGNRGGYDDPRAQALVDAYREGLSERDQFRAVKGLSDFFVDELPLLVLFVSADPIGVRKGVDALHDVAGGAQAGQPFGTYSRTAHLWDVQ